MTSSSPSSSFFAAIQEVGSARSLDQLRASLMRYPFLGYIETDQQVTRIIQACPRRSELDKISVLFVIRDFLMRLRLGHSLEEAQKSAGGLPLYAHDPIGQIADQTDPLPNQVELCHQALVLVRPDSEPDLWAYLHFMLADHLILGAQTEPLSEQYSPNVTALSIDDQTIERLSTEIQQAVDAYQVADEVWQACGQLEESAKARYKCARLLINFTPRKQRAEALRQATNLLESTLSIWKQDTHPRQWGNVQAALGLALEKNPAGLNAETLEQAIDYFKAALEMPLNPSLDPSYERARRQYHLAILYAQRYQGNRANDIEHAIKLLRDGLEIRTRHNYPKEWADSHNSLANALQHRLRGDRAKNMEEAIDAYQAALKVWTRYKNSEQCAAIHRNLAEAYRRRELGLPEENRQAAVEHLREALKVYTKQNYPNEWASIHNSLANLYCHWFSRDWAKNLEQGIAHYQQAHRVYNQADYPRQWAQTINNLANAYCEQSTEKNTTGLQEAIGLYQQALEVRTYQDYPREWAATHNNLGTAYADLHQSEQAIKHFNLALKVRTAGALPEKRMQTTHNLGKVYFDHCRWAEAIAAFEEAQIAGNTLYRQAITAVGKRAEIGRGGTTAHQMAYALAKTGDLAQAVVKLEQGRARLMAEVLARDRALLDQVNDEDRSEYEATVEMIQTLNSELQAAELNAQGSSDGATTARSFVEIAQELSEADDKLSDLVARIQKYKPDFLSDEVNFETLTKAIPANQTLVYMVTTSQGSMALILSPKTGLSDAFSLDERHIVWLDNFCLDDLHAILSGNFLAGSVTGQSELKDTDTLPELLTAMGTDLMAPLAQQLHHLGLNRIMMIPTGFLALLPLQAATVEGSAFQDKFEFAYTPSARALQASRSVLENVKDNPKISLVVGNPLPTDYASLEWARIEAEEVVTVFSSDQDKLLLEEAAELEAVQSKMVNRSYIHFACHGVFNYKQPLTSGLIMANNQRLDLDYLLAKNRLKATRLIVLSACQTAITDFRRVPDEAIGLPAGFLQTGAPGVIGSLWPVDDPTTSLLMGCFYHYHVEKGIEPAAALSLAQQWLRDLPLDEVLIRLEKMREVLMQKKDPLQFEIEEYQYELEERNDEHPFVHPYYWAAFTMNGL